MITASPPLVRLAAVVASFAIGAPAQVTWHRSIDVVPARQGHFGFYDQSRGRVGVVGGDAGGGTYAGDCWQLDRGSEWVVRNGLAWSQRAYGASCKDAGNVGHWILFGGDDDAGNVFGDSLRFDPSTSSFTVLSPAASPSPRRFTAMAFDSTRNRAVLFGGADLAGTFDDTWEWDGDTWAQSAATGPSARSNHAMAFDQARNTTVLFGGYDGIARNDTWSFDANGWTLAAPANSPPPLRNAVLAYDAQRQVVVLFGGRSQANTLANATWEWNGTTWTPRAFTNRPSPRELASLTWDEQRQRLVLVGGGGVGGPLDDAWTYDGIAWTKLEPADRGTLVEPPARRDATLVYDASVNRTLLFGGLAQQGIQWVPLTDTWESAGRVWQQRTPANSPPATFGGVGTRHRGLGGVTYFPGADAFGGLATTMWTWNGTDWNSQPLINASVSQFRHQTAASMQVTSWGGWVFVRRVTTGTSLAISSTVQLIVPSSGIVTPLFLPGGPPATEGGSFAQMPDASESNRVFLYGGAQPAFGGGEIFHGDVWELADTGGLGAVAWTLLPPTSGSPVPPARRDAAVTMCPPVPGGHGPLLYVAGGRGASGPLADAWVFDVNSRVWSPWPVAPTFTPRYGAAATFDTDVLGTSLTHALLFSSYYSEYGYAGAAVVAGGYDGSNVRAEIFDTYDHVGSSQRVTRQLPGVGTALLTHDRNAQRTLLLDDRYRAMWSFDGSRWTPVVGKGPIPAYWFGYSAGDHVQGCYDESIGETVFHGRSTTSSFSLVTGAWTHRASGGPTGIVSIGRQGAGFVYVPSMQKNLYFGGFAGIFAMGDTWSFDAATNQWTQLATTGPAARGWHGMVLDRGRGCVVIFGGTPASDTWEYVPATGWQQRFPQHSPPARWKHTLVYDEVRGRTVCAGGLDGSGNAFVDVWEWDGTDWSQRFPENPTSPTSHLATWDAARERTVAAVFSPLVLHELAAQIDIAGAGNTVQPEGLRFYSQPVLGAPLRLGFHSPLGVAIYTLGIGPAQQPAVLQPPFFCETTNLYSLLLIETAIGTAEPNLVWNAPNIPEMVDLTVVVQAFVPQPANCWRATDALHVRF